MVEQMTHSIKTDYFYIILPLRNVYIPLEPLLITGQLPSQKMGSLKVQS